MPMNGRRDRSPRGYGDVFPQADGDRSAATFAVRLWDAAPSRFSLSPVVSVKTVPPQPIVGLVTTGGSSRTGAIARSGMTTTHARSLIMAATCPREGVGKKRPDT